MEEFRTRELGDALPTSQWYKYKSKYLFMDIQVQEFCTTLWDNVDI